MAWPLAKNLWPRRARAWSTRVMFRLRSALARCARSAASLRVSRSHRSLASGGAAGAGQAVVRTGLDVRPQGSLRISFQGSPIPVKLTTENETCDRVEIAVFTSDDSAGDAGAPVTVRSDGDGGVVVESSGFRQGKARLEGLIPEKFNVDISTSGGNVQLAQLEGSARIATQGGSLAFTKISEGPCRVDSGGGHVVGRAINGNIEMRTSGGDIKVKRVVGVDVDVNVRGPNGATSGSIDIRALYATSTTIQSRMGALSIGTIHGKTQIETQGGDVQVESGADGEIGISSGGGRIDVQLGSSAKKVDFTSQGGDIHIRIPTEMGADIEASGARGVLLDNDFLEQDTIQYTDDTRQSVKGSVAATTGSAEARGYKPTQAVIRADAASGFVELRGKDWLASLGDKFAGLRSL